MTNDSQRPNSKATTPNIETGCNSIPENPNLLEPQTSYPEGGHKAWLVVFGAFCSLTASLGLYNSTGVFEAYISRKILADESSSNIGWIFGIYSFVTWACGVQIGPTFDASGPRGLMVAGSICTLASVFTLSLCTGKIFL